MRFPCLVKPKPFHLAAVPSSIADARTAIEIHFPLPLRPCTPVSAGMRSPLIAYSAIVMYTLYGSST